MRKSGAIFAFLIVVIVLFCLSGCSSTMKGTDQFIEKARKEIPLAEADSMEILYAGRMVEGKKALLWFISGNEYQKHSYFPMECEIVGEDEYRFIRTYRAVERSADIAVLQWNQTYCFLVNQKNCRAIQMTDRAGNTEQIKIESYPYLYHCSEIPQEYEFLDANGERLENG